MMPAGLKVYNSEQRIEVPPMPTQMPQELEKEFRKQKVVGKL